MFQLLIYFLGRCYGLEARCDGISDCPEYSTEQYTCTECQLSAFKCPDDTCIPNFRLCDGVLDCYDGSDEEGDYVYWCAHGFTFSCGSIV